MTAPLILFYGDSRAADWPAPALPGARFANRGIPGDDTAGALRRFPRDAAALAPDVIVLQLGVNDLTGAIYVPPQRAGEIIAACQANLRQIVARAVDLGATLILTTIFPPAADPRAGWSRDHAALAETIEQVNRDLRQLAGERVTLLETAPLLTEQGRVKPDFALDTLHLNRAGYAALNTALGPLLAEITAKS
ncbi:MAG: SGNH/GDSL hydrolase family protein [Anaerolineae bacterium]